MQCRAQCWEGLGKGTVPKELPIYSSQAAREGSSEEVVSELGLKGKEGRLWSREGCFWKPFQSGWNVYEGARVGKA